jgi:DNA-binding IclR family transcriptional regulator
MKVAEKFESGRCDEIRNPQSSVKMQGTILDTEKKPAAVKSVFRAANILTCLSRGIYSVTEIADVCRLNKATVHRLLKALVESNLAIQDSITHRYFLGHAIAQIVASPYTTHEYLVTCAIKPMIHLADFTEETVFLSILIGLRYLNLFEVPSKHDLRVVEIFKKSGYVPAGASSKVLLSQLSAKELKIATLNMDFASQAGDYKMTPESLSQQIKEVRRKNYCISYGERVKGCICISAPIHNYVFPIALSVVGPENRIKPRIKEMVRELKSSAVLLTNHVSETFMHIEGNKTT